MTRNISVRQKQFWNKTCNTVSVLTAVFRYRKKNYSFVLLGLDVTDQLDKKNRDSWIFLKQKLWPGLKTLNKMQFWKVKQKNCNKKPELTAIMASIKII